MHQCRTVGISMVLIGFQSILAVAQLPAPPRGSVPSSELESLGGLARQGSSNHYIPSYLLGVPGISTQPAMSAHIPGGSGAAFPFVNLAGFGEQAPNQPRPGGLMLPPRGRAEPGRSDSIVGPPSNSHPRSDRAVELMEMGDRSFRLGNYHRAEERYLQAARLRGNHQQAAGVRLAEVAIVRQDYPKAAFHLRDAITSANGPGWLLEPPDVQSLFAEPEDFARQIANLESYLQTHPQDRNAWFVLGAQQHLSGRHHQAHDTFLRLTDRTPDSALAALLDATTIARRVETFQRTDTQPFR